MNDTAFDALLARRATHASRSVAVSVAILLVALPVAWLGIEAGLAAAGMRPLLLDPSAMLAALDEPAVRAVAVGVGLVLGVTFLALALSPGRRPRHRLHDERAVVVIDDDVLASGLSRAAQRATGVGLGQATTRVDRRRAVVTVVPTTGRTVDEAAASSAVESVLGALSPEPSVASRVTVAQNGVIG